jgi:opacity protein-like surface antigen
MFKKLLLFFPLLALTQCIHAESNPAYPWYIGFSAGYGATNWSGLIDKTDHDENVQSFLPQTVSDSGAVFGGFLGYTFTENFALEARYQNFPLTRMTFKNTFVYKMKDMSSSTNAYSLAAKFIVPIKRSKFSIFSMFGPAYIIRTDALAGDGTMFRGQPGPDKPGSRGRITVLFGAGLNYNISQRWLLALEGSYIAGYGKSSARPINDYIPFLYAMEFKVAYRFALSS